MARRLKASLSRARAQVVSLEPIPANDEAASKRTWMCADCARKFNPTAQGVFDAIDGRAAAARARRVERTVAMLSELKTAAVLDATAALEPFSHLATAASRGACTPRTPRTPLAAASPREALAPRPEGYPVGEIPSLCTPRAYRALADHAQRARVAHPVQMTAGCAPPPRPPPPPATRPRARRAVCRWARAPTRLCATLPPPPPPPPVLSGRAASLPPVLIGHVFLRDRATKDVLAACYARAQAPPARRKPELPHLTSLRISMDSLAQVRLPPVRTGHVSSLPPVRTGHVSSLPPVPGG